MSERISVIGCCGLTIGIDPCNGAQPLQDQSRGGLQSVLFLGRDRPGLDAVLGSLPWDDPPPEQHLAPRDRVPAGSWRVGAPFSSRGGFWVQKKSRRLPHAIPRGARGHRPEERGAAPSRRGGTLIVATNYIPPSWLRMQFLGPRYWSDVVDPPKQGNSPRASKALRE